MSGDSEQPRLPDRVTMGLLPYLTTHALDEDYEQAASRRRAQTDRTSRPRVGVGGAAALALFAVLAVTAAAQTSQDSVSEERDRRDLIEQVKQSKESLDAARVEESSLRASTSRLRASLLRNTNDSSGLLDQIRLLELRTGTVAVHGPGVTVLADDAPNAESDRNRVLDTDLQKLVNGLWQAGAEAISVNGQRLTALSAIRHAGEAITVNFKSIRRPYRVLAIGDPKTLPARFADTTSGQAWLDLQREVGLSFTMTTAKNLRLPGATVPDQLRFANVATDRAQRKELE